MEFGRRVAIEKDIERNEANFYNNLSKYMIDKKNARMVVRPFFEYKRPNNVIHER